MTGRAARLLAVLLLLLAAALPALAVDFAALVSGLPGEGFAAKRKTVVALGALGDPRAVEVLKALSDDRLRSTAEGRVLIVGTAPDGTPLLSDAITGKPVAGVDPDSLGRIIANNVLRGDIEAALGGLALFSHDRGIRLVAARDVLKHPSAEGAARLEKALAGETDAEVRAAMTTSLFAAHLLTGSKAQQLTAIHGLTGSTDPQVKNLLDTLRARPNLDPELRRAAEAALAAIGHRLRLVAVAANLFEGLSLGSVLLLAAIGLAITFGVMGVINMAHGEMIMLGAYTAFVCQQFFQLWLPPAWFDGYLVAAVPAAFLFAGAVGVALERTVIRFLYGRPLETLLATWGIGLILQQAVRSVFGAPNRAVSNPSWMTGGVDLVGGFTVTWNRVCIILFCLIVLGVLALVLQRTRFGLDMRAVTQNRAMASVMGIRTARIDALTFGLGSGIAGIAGVALSQIGNVSPNLGGIYIVDSFLVVVFGGVGNLLGTLVGALSLGIVNKLLEPVAGAVLGKIAVLVVVILFIQRRPRGLFALKGRTADAES
ncbi:MAG TPA: urea ABC transporter permease subunit UrtB [Stellaceae bacterium]|nr:urea ABC transporter permease subunit UrtB [Stellaceae bacterium]